MEIGLYRTCYYRQVENKMAPINKSFYLKEKTISRYFSNYIDRKLLAEKLAKLIPSIEDGIGSRLGLKTGVWYTGNPVLNDKNGQMREIKADDKLEDIIKNLIGLGPKEDRVLGAGFVPFSFYKRGEIQSTFYNEKILYWLTITVSNLPEKSGRVYNDLYGGFNPSESSRKVEKLLCEVNILSPQEPKLIEETIKSISENF